MKGQEKLRSREMPQLGNDSVGSVSEIIISSKQQNGYQLTQKNQKKSSKQKTADKK